MSPPAHTVLLGLEWPTARSGGLNRYVSELHRSLRGTAEDSADTVVFGPVPPEEAGLHVAGAASAPLPMRLFRQRRVTRELLTPGSVVDAHFALVAAPNLRRLRRAGIPLVTHFHGPWADEAAAAGQRMGRGARRLLELQVARHAQRIICLSGSMARLAIERSGASPWIVEVIPPGVDRDRFRPADADGRRALRTGRGLGDDDFVAVVARRLVPRTGVDLIVAAWPHVASAASEAGRRARLIVVGSGPEQAQLRAMADATTVTFTGAVADDELAEWYRVADVTVVPSRALEGFGLVVLESLASGTPVVVTNVGGLPEAVAGLAGTTVVPSSVDALAECVAAMATGSRPTAPAKVCRDATRERDWSHVAARHAEMFASVAAGADRAERRVVLLDHCAQMSGGEIAACRLIPALPDVRVHAVLFEDGPLPLALGRAGATVEVRPLEGTVLGMSRADAGRLGPTLRAAFTTLWFTARLAVRLRRLRPDVVHANSLKAGLIGGAAARLARIPMVWHVRDRLAPDYMPRRAARLTQRGIRQFAAGVIAPSESVMATVGPAPRRRQVRAVIPDVAPEPGFACGEPVVEPRPDHSLHIVMVGRIAPWKGQDVFVKAFAAAFPDCGAHASIVGEAMFGEHAYGREIEQTRDAHGLGDRLALVGPVADVAAVYAGADIVVHASTVPEPFGQVVLEALSAGVPVIAADAGGPAEIVTHGRDGLLVPPGDVDALAAALRRLAGDPELRSHLAEAGRQRAQWYQGRRIGPKVIELYDAVARNGRTSGG